MYLVDIAELDEQVQAQLRKFRKKAGGFGDSMWYRIQNGLAKLHDMKIKHDKIENFILPNLFDENGDPIYWYHYWDPEQKQVNKVKKNLLKSRQAHRKRGRVTPQRLKNIMEEIVSQRVREYLNPQEAMAKKKILCIVGESGAGKTLASLHLKNHKDANVICSFTTRPPRSTEVEGRDHHFIDIVPDRTQMLAYTHFGGYHYYALKSQVYGPCTVYVVDEKGLQNLRKDWPDNYEIYSVLITRDRELRRRCGVDVRRIDRDKDRELTPEDYDYIVVNNSTKKNFFQQIDSIYEEVKAK